MGLVPFKQCQERRAGSPDSERCAHPWISARFPHMDAKGRIP